MRTVVCRLENSIFEGFPFSPESYAEALRQKIFHRFPHAQVTVEVTDDEDADFIMAVGFTDKNVVAEAINKLHDDLWESWTFTDTVEWEEGDDGDGELREELGIDEDEED